jgi:pimeloyl-ACP methyl ester carboxylesterase
MPYANNAGVKIYYEVEGQGLPLVLAYGLTGGLNCWRAIGIVDLLRNDFQLILFDARGHGRSEKPHEVSAYGLTMANDVVAALDHIGIDKAHYFGYAMGATADFWLAVRHTTRFRSFIPGGTGPYRSEAEIKLEDGLTKAFKRLLNDPEGAIRQEEQLMIALSKAPSAQRTRNMKEAIKRGVDFLLSHDPAVADYPFSSGNRPSSTWFKFYYPLYSEAGVL